MLQDVPPTGARSLNLRRPFRASSSTSGVVREGLLKAISEGAGSRVLQVRNLALPAVGVDERDGVNVAEVGDLAVAGPKLDMASIEHGRLRQGVGVAAEVEGVQRRAAAQVDEGVAQAALIYVTMTWASKTDT